MGADVGNRRTIQTEVERIDKDRRRRRREAVRGEHDNDRRSGLLHASHPAVAGENQQRAGNADDGDAEPAERRLLDGTVVAGQGPRQRAGEDLTDGDDRETEQHREPGRLDPFIDGGPLVAGAEPPGGPRGCAVLDERRHEHHERHQGGADSQGGERFGAEMADDRGINEEVERLGGEHAEG